MPILLLTLTIREGERRAKEGRKKGGEWVGKVRYSGICFYEHESHADAGILAVDGVCFVFCHLKCLIEAAFFLTI